MHSKEKTMRDAAINIRALPAQRALLVHALHDRAREFNEHYGFQSSPLHPMTLMLRLNTSKP